MPRASLLLLSSLALAIPLAACGDDDAGTPNAAPPATSEAAPSTAAAESSAAPEASAPADSSAAVGTADFTAVRSFLDEHTTGLAASAATFLEGSQQYYDLAKAANFDYAKLWAEQQDAVVPILTSLQETYRASNPQYEQMEGIVAGVPSLSRFDVILDAGSSAADDPENAVPFDLTLPDGRVLEKPGNLFYMEETSLFGTNPDFTAKDVQADFDGDGTVEFGEVLPDANVLLGSAQAFDGYAKELATTANAWEPNEADAFTALVVMIPTMNEYFESWKNSRFVAGDTASEQAFAATSRLSDITDILSGLEVVYAGVQPRVAGADATRADQIGAGLGELTDSIAQLRDEESGGRVFKPEEADQLGADKQARASDIAGQISQVAAQLGVEISA